MRRFIVPFAVLTLLVGVALPIEGGCNEEYFDIYCEYECDYTGYCVLPNINRCCYEHVSGGSCGEGALAYCPECQPGGCGF